LIRVTGRFEALIIFVFKEGGREDDDIGIDDIPI